MQPGGPGCCWHVIPDGQADLRTLRIGRDGTKGGIRARITE